MSETVEARATYRFSVSPERVYDAWLDPALVRQWLAPGLKAQGLAGDVRQVEIEPYLDGAFLFSDMRDGVEAAHWGRYLELDPPNKLVFTWVTAPEEEDDPSIVTVVILPADHGATLTLSHRMDARWAAGVPDVERGWGALLDAMAGVLGAGA